MAKIVEFREIPLDDLEIGRSQVRLSEVGEEIDELAKSIEIQGLLQPIMVCQSSEVGKYEIILGQRRFLAHKTLGRDTITAAVLDERVDEITAKVISVTENLVRKDLNRNDLIDVCTYLYNKYGSVQSVADKTGLPYPKVNEYVKFDRLIPELQKLVREGAIEVKLALRAQDAAAAASDGINDPGTAVALAKEMSTMSGVQQKKIQEKIKEGVSVGDAIERAKSGEKVTQIVVTLSQPVHETLSRFAKEEGTTMDDAAASLIEKSLTDMGLSSVGGGD